MIHYTPSNQLSFSEFKTPFETALDKNNRWVKLSQCIPWDALAEIYMSGFSHTGRRAKDPRLVIGATIIKHKLCLSDEETVEQIHENPYLQFFVGFPAYTTDTPFAPSLFVEIRRRMDKSVYQRFEQTIINTIDAIKTNQETSKDDDNPSTGSTPPDNKKGKETKETDEDKESLSKATQHTKNQGKLIIDATVAPQQIRYPTDISLLNEAREISEKIIDSLHAQRKGKKKPRTYRQRARKDYLAIAKQKRPRAKTRRKAIRKQLNYLKRNLKHINALWDELSQNTLPCTAISMQFNDKLLSHLQQKQLWVIQQLYQQQQDMYDKKTNRCDERIVSIHQPHVRPIVRGKADKTAEFGAKLSVSLTGEGIACLDKTRWSAFNEGLDLKIQVKNYKQRHGYYPDVVLADPIYGSRENRNYLKEKGIRYGGKPLGRPKKVTEENKEQLKQEKKQRTADYRQRIPIEGKFGQGKNGYGLNQIKAKTPRTSESWTAAIFFVMNLLVLSQVWDFLAQIKRRLGHFLLIITDNIPRIREREIIMVKFEYYSPGINVRYFSF